MRVRYIRTEDVDVLEGTVNLLLAQGWEISTSVVITDVNDYFITMVTYDRPLRGLARALDMPFLNTDGTQPTTRGVHTHDPRTHAEQQVPHSLGEQEPR